MPSLKWTKYIPNKPTPKQLAFLMLPNEEAMFGGALGGGKSDVLLMGALQYVDVPGYSAIIFRRQLSDLKQPGALIDRTLKWLAPFTARKEVKWVPSEHTFYFPTQWPDGTEGHPSKLCFGYIGEAEIRERYQSAEYSYIAFDELTSWEDSIDYSFMFSRIRQPVCPLHPTKDGKAQWKDDCMYCRVLKNVPKRMRSATNPGGRGGTWVKNWFDIKPDPEKYPSRKEALVALQRGEHVKFVGCHPTRAFIPSFLEDNPFLNLEEYDKMLVNLSEQDQDRLRSGNWEFRPDSRFKRVWAKYYEQHGRSYHLPHKIIQHDDLKLCFSTVDPAASVKHGPVDDQVRRGARSYSVISVWGVTKDNLLLWLDMVRFRKEIPDVVEMIIKMNKIWKPQYFKIEYNGNAMGVAQYAELYNVPVVKNKKTIDKLENSVTAQMLMKAGRIYLPDNAHWLEEAEDEVFGWTGLPDTNDDIIDTLSDAANDVVHEGSHIPAPETPAVMSSTPVRHVAGGLPKNYYA